jgi:hypothetical protein
MDLPRNGYSAEVRLQLLVDGQTLAVRQVSPDSCLLVQPIDHPPCQGRFVLSVDGRRREYPVILPQGISRTSSLVKFG